MRKRERTAEQIAAAEARSGYLELQVTFDALSDFVGDLGRVLGANAGRCGEHALRRGARAAMDLGANVWMDVYGAARETPPDQPSKNENFDGLAMNRDGVGDGSKNSNVPDFSP